MLRRFCTGERLGTFFCRSGMPEKMYRVAILKTRENLQRLFEHPPYVVLR